MSDTLRTIAALVQRGELRISAHGYDEMAEDGILAGDAIDGVTDAVVVEDYPDYSKGPCVLLTAYRPDPALWTDDFLRRRQ